MPITSLFNFHVLGGGGLGYLVGGRNGEAYQLMETLRRIEGKPYPAYRDTEGTWRFGGQVRGGSWATSNIPYRYIVVIKVCHSMPQYKARTKQVRMD